MAYCLWLGAAVPELTIELDPLGRARVRADNAGRVFRHAGLVDAVGDLMTEAGYRMWRKVTGIYGPFPLYTSQAARRGVARGEQRRMDLVGVTIDLEAVCVDPTLLGAAAPQLLARVQSHPALDAAEAEKDAHYADTPAPFNLVAFGAGTQAELGASASAFLSALALRLARRRNGGQQPGARLLASVQPYVRVV